MTAGRGLQRRNALQLVIAVGILALGAGLGFDLLPGTRPGIHTLQLLAILSGLILILIPLAVLRWDRLRFAANQWRALAAILTITLFTLLVLEFILTALGYETYFPQGAPETDLRAAPWWTCQGALCRSIPAEATKACESGQLTGRDCLVNAQGFHDSQDFIYQPELDARLRVLVLGDSFTFGADADIGKSYVETIEANAPEAVVWNTGIFGVGTNQALNAFKRFAPDLKPQATLYGFYVNDFFDNLFPVDGYFLGIDADGAVTRLQQYHLDPWGNVTKLDLDRLAYYRGRGIEAPANELERLLGSTRLGSIAVGAIDYAGKLSGVAQRAQDNLKVELTRAYLRELRDANIRQGSALLIMLIPSLPDLAEPGKDYRLALRLFEELKISHFTPLDLLDAQNDYAPDWHWNNAGHQKVGALLNDCLASFAAAGDFSECVLVKQP